MEVGSIFVGLRCYSEQLCCFIVTIVISATIISVQLEILHLVYFH